MDVKRIIEGLPNKSADERDRIRANADRMLSMGTEEQIDAAQTVISALRDLEEAEHRQLVDRLNGMEVSARVVEAFTIHPMTETEAKLIQALLDAPGSSSTELSQALGWGGQAWHMHFGTMCFNRATYLWPAPKAEARNADFYSGILADWTPEGQWSMKPDVAAAFAQLGLRAGM